MSNTLDEMKKKIKKAKRVAVEKAKETIRKTKNLAPAAVLAAASMAPTSSAQAATGPGDGNGNDVVQTLNEKYAGTGIKFQAVDGNSKTGQQNAQRTNVDSRTYTTTAADYSRPAASTARARANSGDQIVVNGVTYVRDPVLTAGLSPYNEKGAVGIFINPADLADPMKQENAVSVVVQRHNGTTYYSDLGCILSRYEKGTYEYKGCPHPGFIYGGLGAVGGGFDINVGNGGVGVSVGGMGRSGAGHVSVNAGRDGVGVSVGGMGRSGTGHVSVGVGKGGIHIGGGGVRVRGR